MRGLLNPPRDPAQFMRGSRSASSRKGSPGGGGGVGRPDLPMKQGLADLRRPWRESDEFSGARACWGRARWMVPLVAEMAVRVELQLYGRWLCGCRHDRLLPG